MRFPIALVVAAAACNTSSPRAEHTPVDQQANKAVAPVCDHEPIASLERTSCYGWCPVYKVTVFSDGIVEYQGEHYVKTKGRAVGHLDPKELAALHDLFQRNGYRSLKGSYEEYYVSDNPSAYTLYSLADGTMKPVRHYFGDQSAPKALLDIEQGIDQIVHIEQWIGTESERRASHYFAHEISSTTR